MNILKVLKNKAHSVLITKMPAPKGNQNAKGNSGGKKGRSGRKSAYAEIADATTLWNAFITKYDKEEVVEILKGKHSIRDIWIAKAYGGNEKFIQQIVNKLFPDRQNVGIETNQDNIRELSEFFRRMAEPQIKNS